MPEHRRLRLLGGVLQLPQRCMVLFDALVVLAPTLEVLEGGACPRDEGLVVQTRARRDRERQQHPGDRRVDARLVHGQPERDAEHAIDHRAPHAEAVGREEPSEHDRRRSKRGQRQVGRVEQRDDADREQVIGDRERREEDAQAERAPGSRRAPGRPGRTRCRSPSGCPIRACPRHCPRCPGRCIAGRIAPPMAAAIGSVARRTDASSPTRTSRLISRPTTRKKTAMRPSLIQWSRVSETERSPRSTRQLRRPQRLVGCRTRPSSPIPARRWPRPGAGSRPTTLLRRTPGRGPGHGRSARRRRLSRWGDGFGQPSPGRPDAGRHHR